MIYPSSALRGSKILLVSTVKTIIIKTAKVKTKIQVVILLTGAEQFVGNAYMMPPSFAGMVSISFPF